MKYRLFIFFIAIFSLSCQAADKSKNNHGKVVGKPAPEKILLSDLNGQWQLVGPNAMPNNPTYRGDAGIGPIEFVRASAKKEGYLLAGSLHGGLFFSDNGGEFWFNSGSDDWDFSGCSWADFYPENEQTWFACSNISGDNGKPGSVGKKGGLLRTTDAGNEWELIADYTDLGSPYVRIYGTRFHPNDPELLFMLTSNGLFYTESCLASNVKWQRVPQLNGIVYDLDFVAGKMMVANEVKKDWQLLMFNQDVFTQFEVVKDVVLPDEKLRHLTFEPRKNSLLVVKDLTKGGDEVWAYFPETKKKELILKGQNISFGSGHTFAVSPFNPDYFYLGFSTRMRKWDYANRKKVKQGSNYHVDIEFVCYDPFDSSKVYLGTHGGVFMSADNGANWESRSNGLGVCEVMGLAVSESDPRQVAVGTYHDGSMLFADFANDGNYYWRTINGGDGLIPLINPQNKQAIYTSNQFSGGGLFYTENATESKGINLHTKNKLKTSGWEMAVAYSPAYQNGVIFNYKELKGPNKGNINAFRISDINQPDKGEKITDFFESHKMQSYKVYGLYTSMDHPNVLLAYVLHYTKDKNGKISTRHRVFRNKNCTAPAGEVINGWHELEHPNNTWISDIEVDGNDVNKIYLSYTHGNDNPESIFGDKGMVYTLRYADKEPYRQKSEIDISRNLPISQAGRYNLVYTKREGGTAFIATRTGVYYGKRRTLKGKFRWQKVGHGLPHCKVYGLHYNQEAGVLTVGLFGRGVWQYYLD